VAAAAREAQIAHRARTKMNWHCARWRRGGGSKQYAARAHSQIEYKWAKIRHSAHSCNDVSLTEGKTLSSLLSLTQQCSVLSLLHSIPVPPPTLARSLTKARSADIVSFNVAGALVITMKGRQIALALSCSRSGCHAPLWRSSCKHMCLSYPSIIIPFLMLH